MFRHCPIWNGLRDKRTKEVSLENAIRYLDYATQNGIMALDTAEAYGTA